MIARVLALTAALLLAVMTTSVARAQDEEGEGEEEAEAEEGSYAKESAAYIGVSGLGGAIGDDGTGGFGVLLGAHITTWLAFEGEYDFIASEATSIGTYSVKWVPLGESRIQPYLKTGLGLMGGRDDHPFLFMGKFAGGVEFFVTDQIAVDAGVSAGIASHDNNLYTGSLGVVYYFE